MSKSLANSLHSKIQTRRNWLKTAGMTIASVPFLNRVTDSANKEEPAKIKSNLKLGIMSDCYGALPLQTAVERIASDGFTYVITNYTFADVRFDLSKPDWEAAKKIVSAFEQKGIKIASAFGYYNVVSPNPDVRKQGEQRMECFFANWKRLGCPIISTETGTLNPQSEWLISPENSTEAAYVECRKVLERLARIAEKTGAILSIEPYWQNIIDSIERAERLFREVNSPALKLVMDPCNYYRKEDLPKMQPMLEEMFKRLGDRIVLAHAKDVKAAKTGTDLPAAGQGVLDYPLYLRLLNQLGREMPLIIEHLTLEEIVRTRDFVQGHMKKL